jgi:hypothetical protein
MTKFVIHVHVRSTCSDRNCSIFNTSSELLYFQYFLGTALFSILPLIALLLQTCEFKRSGISLVDLINSLEQK